MDNKRYILSICIALTLLSCHVKKSKHDIFQVDTVIVGNKQVIEREYFVFDEVEQDINYDKKILHICDSLNNTLEVNVNEGILISELIRKSKYPAKSAYCGILVNEILTKAGIQHDVDEYGRASAWFKDMTKVIYVKGTWKTLEREPKIGYVVGMSFEKHRDISHVGIFIKEINDWVLVKTFEGNTSKDGTKQQGIFYKQRNPNILWIRKW